MHDALLVVHSMRERGLFSDRKSVMAERVDRAVRYLQNKRQLLQEIGDDLASKANLANR